MKINPIEWFAKTKVGTKFYKWAASEKGSAFLYKQLPNIESCVATLSYVYATEKQQKLDRREKNVLQYQNVIPAIVGISSGAYLNKKVYDFSEKIIKHVDPKKVPDIHKIAGAVRVLSPILLTSFIMRFISPVITAYISGEIEEYRAKKNKLDIKA